MGLSIHYEGTASSFESVSSILSRVELYSNENNWKIDAIDKNNIIVIPHPKCESLSFVFNDNLKFSGCTKTGYAPTEIHEQVVKLFFEIKPHFKKLKIDDESGYWDAYQDVIRNKPIREIIDFPVASESDVIKEILYLPDNSLKCDFGFWNSDPLFAKPAVLHLPSIRNRMGYDLTNGSSYAFVVRDLLKDLSLNGFFTWDHDWFNDECNYIVELSKLWAWKMSAGNPTNIKRNRCIAFGYAVGKGCYGLENGFFNKTHRDAWIALDILEQKEIEASPLRSLEILYALFDFCGFKKLNG